MEAMAGEGLGLGTGGQARSAVLALLAGCDGGQAGTLELGSSLTSLGRWTELTGARLVMVLLAAGWMVGGHGHGLPWGHMCQKESSPACKEVVRGAHTQEAALGTMWGAQSLQGKAGTPISMGHGPLPQSQG